MARCFHSMPIHILSGILVYRYLEENDLLHIENELQLFVLQIVFIPRINEHLNRFRKGWDSHPLSSERNRMPDQLWLIGQLNYAPNNDFNTVDDHYGIDPLRPIANTEFGVQPQVLPPF